MTEAAAADAADWTDQPHVEIERDGVHYTLLGTAHISKASIEAVRSAIAGLTPAAAIDLVQQRWPLEAPPEIHRDPEWFATLPAIGNRIQVRIAYANQLASQ